MTKWCPLSCGFCKHEAPAGKKKNCSGENLAIDLFTLFSTFYGQSGLGVLSEYLSVTSQLMVESRTDRAENAWGLGRENPSTPLKRAP